MVATDDYILMGEQILGMDSVRRDDAMDHAVSIGHRVDGLSGDRRLDSGIVNDYEVSYGTKRLAR